MKIFLLLLAGIPVLATTVYMPAIGAKSCTLSGASNATPSQISCTAHGFSAGDKIAILDTIATQTAGWIVNGLRVVKAVQDADHFTITDINNADIVGPSSWACPSNIHPSNITRPVGCRAVQLTAYTTRSHPRTYGLDGPTGALSLSLQDTSGTGKANAANFLWGSLQTAVTNFTTSAVPVGDIGAGLGASALLYWATGDTGAQTKALNALAENQWNLNLGSFACYTGDISCGHRAGAQDYINAPWFLGQKALGYSIMRSQLTSGQRTAIMNQFYNDLDRAHNGFGMAGAPDTGCAATPYAQGTGTATFTNGSTALVGVGTNFTSYSVGDMIFAGAPGQWFDNDAENVIASITDNTHLTFALPFTLTTRSGINFMRAQVWDATMCGSIHFVKYECCSPLGDNINYNISGQVHFQDRPDNKTITSNAGWLMWAMATADDDPRAVDLLARMSAYFYDQYLTSTKQLQTGVSWTAPPYYNNRNLFFSLMAAVAITNGGGGGPDYFSADNYSFLRAMPQAYMLFMPSSGNNATTAGTWGDSGIFGWDVLESQWMGLIAYMYPNSAEAKYFTWWFRDPSSRNAYASGFSWNSANSYAVPPNWVFADPNRPQTSLASAPKQYLFRHTDQGECAAYNFTCNATYYMGAIASKSDNTSSTATLLFVDAMGFIYGDHVGPQESGEYQIYKANTNLLGGNNGSNAGDIGSLPHGGEDNTTLEFGALSNWLPQNGTDFFVTTIPRWAGTDPTGPSNDKYIYSMIDLSGQYKASVGITRALRHIAHFKKPSTTEQIIAYDDLATSSGVAKFTHLPFHCNGAAYPCGVTRSGNTVTSVQSGASLKTNILTPSGQTNFFTETSWSVPAAYTTLLCAATGGAATTCDTSNTAAEWVVVNTPYTGTAPTITLSQLAEPNFRVVQADDSAGSKVVPFGQAGSTYSSASFTSTHSGTAQYLIAGLTPGTYDFKVGGSTICAGVVVVAGDNSLYCEASSGAVTIAAASATTATVSGQAVTATQAVIIVTTTQAGECNYSGSERVYLTYDG